MSVKIIQTVAELAAPIVEENGLTLWHVEFKKEGADWFLRVFIDSDAAVTLEHCETVSRALEKKLDEKDPIETQYILEISSAGITRDLITDEHYKKMQGKEIEIKLYKPNAKKQKILVGILKDHSGGIISLLQDEQIIEIKQSECAKVNLYYSF